MNYAVSGSNWNQIYSSLSSNDKTKVISLLSELIDKSYNDNHNFESEISNWSTDEFFLNLDILEKFEFAIACIDVANYNTVNDQHNKVEEYPLSAAQKTLILYLIGDKTWSDITTQNKQDIFDFVDEIYLTGSEKGSILSMLGYKVVFENDGDHFTAYW